MKIDTKKRLNDSLHNVIYKLSSDDTLTFKEACDILSKTYNINISPDLLYLIVEKWSRNIKTNIFIVKDRNWLGFDSKNKLLFNNRYYKDPILGKHRKSMIEEDKLKKKKKSQDINTEYNTKTVGGKKEMHHIYVLSSQVLMGTFKNIILRQMEEIRDKIISSDADKTYDGYWNKMIEIGKSMGLKLDDNYMNYSPKEIQKKLS